MKPQPPVMMHLGRFTASARATVSVSTVAENSRTALTTRSHSASPSHQPTGRQTISSAKVLSLGSRLLKRATQLCTSLRWCTADTVTPLAAMCSMKAPRRPSVSRSVYSQ